LLVLGSGCEELCDARLLPPRTFAGLRDTLRVLLEVARGGAGPSVGGDVLRKIERQIEELDRAPATLAAAHALLARLTSSAVELTEVWGSDVEFAWWANAYRRCQEDHREELSRLAGWLALPAPPAGMWESGSAEQTARLGRLREMLERLDVSATLHEVAELPASALARIEEARREAPAEIDAWLAKLAAALAVSSERAAARILELKDVAAACRETADMDFGLLYDSARDLFAIGYNVNERRLDASFYDLLASEARLASFVVVARGNVGQEHWFALGRLLTSAGRVPALLSWSGSMFEYLMPLLVMPNYENTLLDRTYHAVVRRQVEYGRQRGVPWGISESGYNTIDQHRTYQYRAFGVPGLGLKRGLAEDLVIAPYASVLALMVAPKTACRNLERLAAEGQEGAYGLYEAVDYTRMALSFPESRSGDHVWPQVLVS